MQGTIVCGFCATAITKQQQDRLDGPEDNVIWIHVNTLVLIIWGILLICGLPFSIIGALIAYYWTGPECVKAALKAGRSPNWAFLCGGFFSFFGWGMYWVYLRFKGDL